MTLLNGLLALGALAFTIPLAIHLLFRSRFRTVDWGAMHLLGNVVRVNRRRMELMNLLLLLLRCAIPILLAFCLARPVLTGFQSLPGDAPRSVVIAIDDSRSMSARMPDGRRRITHVSEQLESIFETLSRRDEVMLLRSSTVDAVVGSMGASDAMSACRNLSAVGGPIDLGRLIRRAVEVAGEANHIERQIIVVSDFQSHMIDDTAIESLKRLARSLDEAEYRPTICFMNVGADSSELSNVVVESIESESPAIIAGRSAKFVARIRNGSDTPINDLRFAWTVAGNALPSHTTSIAARSSASVRLTHKFDEVGVQAIAVSVEHSDALPEDNQRLIGVDVIRQVDVILVDGQPSKKPLGGEADFLAVALSPFAFGGQDQPDAVRTIVTSENKMVQELDRQSPAIVVLANVGRLNDASRGRLARFVNEGGALVVFDGDQVDPEIYNQTWSDADHSISMPARMGEVIGQPYRDDAEAVRFPIGQLNTQYAAWSLIGPSTGDDPASSAVCDVDVTSHRVLTIDDVAPDADTSPTVTLLAFESGKPLVVRRAEGRGQIMQFAIGCDADWSNLPMRLVFLPMMQQMVLDLAGTQKQTTVDVGSTIMVATDELESLFTTDIKRDSRKPPTYSVRQPIGEELTLEPSGQTPSVLSLANAASAGVYQFRETQWTADGKPFSTQTIRVAEVPSIESQLREADASRMSRAAELIEATIHVDARSIASDDQTRRFGREIWRWLLVGLLIALIGELFLQQRSRSSKKQPIAKATGVMGGAS
ncbi:hypothetical protein Poly51_57420 [Rubripirellula tenax]|uniref:Aerotolerance regulator N-terminal domain-containing protein n=1 Tax=Rubripirellula tenax TaxID=2528015 RepID=A0A5C6EFH5_9BACT|nr:BatA domain-containing protein [Rubripirellula tenax]TWU46346.1 hypothetical protein Poly51_57420 [Rubripirellula tenax]